MSLGVLFKVQAADGQPGTSARLLFSGARIPRETFRVMSLADDVLREAETAAAQLLQQAAAAAASHTRQAREQGFAQGRADAMVAVLGTLEVERRLRQLLSHRLADIVEHCVRSLIGELGAPEPMRARVLHLLRSAGADATSPAAAPGAPAASPSQPYAGQAPGTVTLYVCPAELAAAQSIAAELGRSAGAPVAGLVVVADKHRAPGALLLETRVGFIDSNLQLTLQEARELLQNVLVHAMQVLGDDV